MIVSSSQRDGSAQPQPVASGRLNSEFPDVDRRDSIIDRQGQIVGPWSNFSTPVTTPPGPERAYQLALWPIGNVFKAGDRIRLTILGASAASLVSLPAINTIRLGGPAGSTLLLPALPAHSTATHRVRRGR